jgi:solute carrier family 25 carnitine/acylcarnitine transporter 20/29
MDTIKTIKQYEKSLIPSSYTQIVRNLIKTDGVRGLYRGSVAPLLGGAFFRSAQFGFYETTIAALRKTTTDHKFFGFLSWHVVVAGASGGLGRGLIEGFADHIKVRRMLAKPWNLQSLRYESGLGITLIRNVNLFGSFVIFMDLSKQLTNGQLGPFMTGGICASLAWFTIWPLDVVKSRVQSGDFHPDQKLSWQLKEVVQTGAIFRGLAPGLVRAFVANGCSMIMYRKTESFLRGN